MRGLERHGGVYGGWAQNDPNKIVVAIRRAVARKITIARRHGFADFDEVWLLVSCGVPELGAVISTFVMTLWLHADALNTATGGDLASSKYAHAFVHPVVGLGNALYQWTASTGWRKHTTETRPGPRAFKPARYARRVAPPGGSAIVQSGGRLMTARCRGPTARVSTPLGDHAPDLGMIAFPDADGLTSAEVGRRLRPRPRLDFDRGRAGRA